MLSKKTKLEKAIETQQPLKDVTNLFIDYKEGYKRLRNPNRTQDQSFERMYNKYCDYVESLKEKTK